MISTVLELPRLSTWVAFARAVYASSAVSALNHERSPNSSMRGSWIARDPTRPLTFSNLVRFAPPPRENGPALIAPARPSLGARLVAPSTGVESTYISFVCAVYSRGCRNRRTANPVSVTKPVTSDTSFHCRATMRR